jgi:exoribonuclease R
VNAVVSHYLTIAQPQDALSEGFDRIRQELGVPQGFGPQAMSDAMAAAARPPEPPVDATDLPFVTIDPAGAMDLDQAVFIERVGPGYRVHYAIADVPGFLSADSALDHEVRERVMTLYSPDRKVPLHPPVLSEGAASLLPDELRPALVWQIDLDSDAALRQVGLRRAAVRSRAKLAYEEVQEQIDGGVADESIALLREVGLLLQEQERARGGVSLPGAEQEVHTDGRTYELVMREPLPVERWNAQISLLTGRAAAQMMLEGDIGILRTMPDPTPGDIGRVRAVARSLGIDWPKDSGYAEVISRMDPTVPAEAALLNAAPVLLRGAGYAAFDGSPPALTTHSAVAAPYAHVTAPLRRLVDRWGLQVCLSLCDGSPPPEWVTASLASVPDVMGEGGRRARALDRANVDLVEAFVLRTRVGEQFEAVVLDNRKDTSLIQLREPAVIARTEGELPLGTRVVVRLTEADVDRREVRLVPADQAGESV